MVGKTVTYELLSAGDPLPLSVSTSPDSCLNRHPLILPVAGRLLVHVGFDYLSHHRRGQHDDDWSKEVGITDNF